MRRSIILNEEFMKTSLQGQRDGLALIRMLHLQSSKSAMLDLDTIEFLIVNSR